MYERNSLMASHDGYQVVLAGAEDLVAAEVTPITYQTACGDHNSRPDPMNAHLFACAPNFLYTLQAIEATWKTGRMSDSERGRQMAELAKITLDSFETYKPETD